MRTPACALLLLAGCLGPEPALPGPMPGGGFSDWDAGGHPGVVYVIDARDAPIEGADVYQLETYVGTTNEEGYVRVSGELGSITAVAGGRAVTTGARSARAITIVVPDAQTPSAIVTATLEGFGSIPFTGDYLIARAGFTLTPRIASSENEITPVADEVVVCEGGADCTVRIATRTGALRVFLAISEGFEEGVAGERSDDRLEPLALAVTEVRELAAGQEVSLPFVLLEERDLVAVEITSGAPPAEVDRVVGVPGALTEAGVLVWPIELGPRALIPRAIDGEQASHWVIGRALPESSTAIRRAVSFSGPTEAAAMLPALPIVTMRADDAFEVAPAAGDGSLVQVDVSDESGALVWRQVLTSGSIVYAPSIITMPARGTLRVTTIEHPAPSDGELSLARVEEQWTARASRTIELAPPCPWARCE